ncbi:hypothetical protein OZ429_10995 [Xanthomonas fragariae]|nr:hypothetical protein [Xanthomonas fragariae]WAT13701.1 hypothetical protein OZ429_10995 [Xanthomonas fragariae]
MTFSERGVLEVENILGEEAARPLRIPPGQRGFATAELLAGDLSVNQALRSAGLFATAADTVITGQRATQFLGQDNPLAAQSELAHFAGRNVGGWAGGTTAAYALGSTGAGPMVLIAADAYFMSEAGEKAAELLDNRAIYKQTDRDGTQWSFDGRAWARDGMADTTRDGVDNPTATPIIASYEKARELNYQATNAAAALALKDAPAPGDPYRQPANATDRPSLSTADWKRDAADGHWHRLVKTEVTGANERGTYVQEIALPPRAAELEAQAHAVIARNIANSPGAIAARYELAYHRSGWAADGLPISPAVQQALADPDALTASNGQRYYRNIDGQWTSNGVAADGNRALELETMRAMLQPALAAHAETIATIQQSPMSPQDLQREQTLYRYRIVGTELQPDWREAIELATQRTRQAHGLSGHGALQVQRGPSGVFGADSPFAHLQRGADGVDRIVAVTSAEEIGQALQEVRGRQQTLPPSLEPPTRHLMTTALASNDSADTDTSSPASSSSSSSSSPQRVLDMQTRMQVDSAAQVQQEREQQARQAQQASQMREHMVQVQLAHEEQVRAAQALHIHVTLEQQRQAMQQREQEERQAQQTQQREQQREAQDAQQREQEQRQAQESQQREQQTRQAQEAQQRDQEQRQAQESQQREQQTRQAQEIQQRDQEQRQAQESQQREQQTRQAQEIQQRDQEQHQAQQTQQHEHAIRQAQQRQQDHHQAQEVHWREQQSAQDVAIAHAPPLAPQYPQHDASPQQLPTAHAAAVRHDASDASGTGTSTQQQQAPAHPQIAQALTERSEPPLAGSFAAARSNDQHTQTPKTPAMDVPSAPAAWPSSTHLTQTTGQPLGAASAARSTDMPTGMEDASQPPVGSSAGAQSTHAAAEPGSLASWQETLHTMRTLRIKLEQEFQEEQRLSQLTHAQREHEDNFPFPLTDIDINHRHNVYAPAPDGDAAFRSQHAMERTAPPTTAQGSDALDDARQPKRRDISNNPDVNDLLYAIQSKNDLAIDEALQRIAESAAASALGFGLFYCAHRRRLAT